MNTQILLILITALYSFQAISYLVHDNPAKALVIVGYVIANCGLIAVK